MYTAVQKNKKVKYDSYNKNKYKNLFCKKFCFVTIKNDVKKKFSK